MSPNSCHQLKLRFKRSLKNYVLGKRNNIPSSLIVFLRKRREQKSGNFSPERQEFIFPYFSSPLKAAHFWKAETHRTTKSIKREARKRRDISHGKRQHTLISTSIDLCSLLFSHCFQWFCAQVQCFKIQESTCITWAPTSFASSYTHNLYVFFSQQLIQWSKNMFYARNTYFHAF